MKVFAILILVVGLIAGILYYTSGTFRFAVHHPKDFYRCLRSEAPIDQCAGDLGGVVDSAAGALRRGSERLDREVKQVQVR